MAACTDSLHGPTACATIVSHRVKRIFSPKPIVTTPAGRRFSLLRQLAVVVSFQHISRRALYKMAQGQAVATFPALYCGPCASPTTPRQSPMQKHEGPRLPRRSDPAWGQTKTLVAVICVLGLALVVALVGRWS